MCKELLRGVHSHPYEEDDPMEAGTPMYGDLDIIRALCDPDMVLVEGDEIMREVVPLRQRQPPVKDGATPRPSPQPASLVPRVAARRCGRTASTVAGTSAI